MSIYAEMADDTEARRASHSKAAQPYIDAILRLYRKWAALPRGGEPSLDDGDKLELLQAKVCFCDFEARGKKFPGYHGIQVMRRGDTLAHWIDYSKLASEMDDWWQPPLTPEQLA